MFDMNSLKLVAVAASIAALSACASSPSTSSTTTTTSYPSAPATAQFGRVTNVELVSVQQKPASGIGAGAVIGGVVGGLLGHQVGGGTGQDIATVAGVVGGALIGNAIQKSQTPPTVSQLYRVTVQQDNGAVRAFDYAEQPNVRVGDRVRIEDDQLYRSVTRERVAQSHDAGTGARYVLEK
jgi:outer membrane lipoprotein SlyB